MTMAQDNMFRAYDIRGVYGKELTPEFAERLGKAIGTFFGQGKAIAVARDTRESGKVLKESLVRGLTSVGCDVVDFELFPTPSTALVVIRRHLGGAVVVSASHNTAEWNGFIPINSDGLICSEGFGMERIKELFSTQAFAQPEKEGKVSTLDATQDYMDTILNHVDITKKFRVVLDVRGGATYLVGPTAFSRVGCEVTTINDKIDGRFSGQKPDVTEDGLSALKKAVVEHDADVGIAFDADGDRAALRRFQGEVLRLGQRDDRHLLRVLPGEIEGCQDRVRRVLLIVHRRVRQV